MRPGRLRRTLLLVLEAELVNGIENVDPTEWDALDRGGSPFLEHVYLRALETSSATVDHGVLPQHLVICQDGRVVAACPLYVKGDGRGEFIYDYQWWMLAERLGVPYYPKAVSMVPFTPATCPHFLFAPGVARERLLPLMAETIEESTRAAGLNGVHYLFLQEDEARALEQLGHVRRLSSQLVLENRGWSDFEDYLACFRARHRKKIRRELRSVEAQGLTIEVLEGDAIEAEHLELMYEFYSITCREHGTGSHYLKRETWEVLFGEWSHRLLLCLARHDGEAVGGSLSVTGDGNLHGRYWGCRGHWPDLYFNLAFYTPIRVLIEKGWQRFSSGFGNSPGKFARGFVPMATHSAHRIFDDRFQEVLAEYLAEERQAVARDLETAREECPLRPSDGLECADV
ncbi:MAG: GNAT family N-acetyltransferase [Acidobacteriota bacterium]